MNRLEEKILKEGKVLPGDIIKLDGFLNHRIDTEVLAYIASEFEKRFNLSGVNMILTAEASGIPLATVCSMKWGIPMLFAKKAKSDNIEGGLYKSDIVSYTYKKTVTQIVSKEWLNKDNTVLIVDDFMARGESIKGLINLVYQAGASLRGVAVAVEKGFQGGGDKLRNIEGLDYYALAVIDKIDSGEITFRKNESL